MKNFLALLPLVALFFSSCSSLKYFSIKKLPFEKGDIEEYTSSEIPEDIGVEYQLIKKEEEGYTHFRIHKVQKGDSLWKISQMYKVTIEDIKKFNNLSSNLILMNRKLKIPKY